MKNTRHVITLLMLIQVLSGCGRTEQDTSEPWAIDGVDAAADMGSALDLAREADAGDADMSVALDQGSPADLGPASDNSCERPITLIPEQPSAPVPWPRAQEPICNGDLRAQVHYAVEVPDGHRLTMYGDGVGVRESCGQACLLSDDALINRRGEPMMVRVSAQRGGDEDDEAQVMARLTPLATNSSCERARVILPGDVLLKEDALAGAAFYNPCQLVQSGHTLYYRVSLRLGERPSAVRIKAMPDDAQNLSISLQALLVEEDAQCSTVCSGSDDAYFRSAPEAVLRVDASAGAGRDPINLLIAVTMAPSWRPEDASTFTLSVEALD